MRTHQCPDCHEWVTYQDDDRYEHGHAPGCEGAQVCDCAPGWRHLPNCPLVTDDLAPGGAGTPADAVFSRRTDGAVTPEAGAKYDLVKPTDAARAAPEVRANPEAATLLFEPRVEDGGASGEGNEPATGAA